MSQDQGLLQAVGQVIHFIKNALGFYKETSLTEITSVTRVEPITVISRDVANLDYTGEVLQSLLNIFAGYYLQAVSLTARVGNVRIVKILDQLNPDRDATGFFAGLESYNRNVLSMEGYAYKLPRISAEASQTGPVEGSADFDSAIGGKNVLVESANLSVGKLITVEVSIDNKSMKVPVNVRLASATIPDNSVRHMLTLFKDDNTLGERYHAWRAGKIGFWKDLVLCQDLLNEHKKALVEDKEGVYSEIVRRTNNAKKFGLATGHASMVSASAIYVISEETKRVVERELMGKFENSRVRDRIFENTFAMIICVIDREWDRVTFYYRGVSAPTTVSVKDIKAANKNKGPDIADIMKSFMSGGSAAPTF